MKSPKLTPKGTRAFWPKASSVMLKSFKDWLLEKLDIEWRVLSDFKLLLKDADPEKESTYQDQKWMKYILKPAGYKKPAKIKNLWEKRSDLYSITAFGTAAGYDLDEILNGMKDLAITNAAYYIRGDVDIIHSIRENYRAEASEAFVFREGVLVLWNYNEEEANSVLNLLAKNQAFSFPTEEVMQSLERVYYKVRRERYCEVDENGYLILPKDTNFYEKYTTSCVVATSVNLSIWQRVLEEHLGTVMDNVAYDLKDGNRVSATDSRVAKLNGTLMSLRYFIKLNDTLCQPIAGGDQPKLDHFHKRLWIHFSIPRRIKNVEKRLHHCFQTMDLVRVLYSYKKHAFSAILYYILSIITLAYSIMSTLFKIRQSRANRLKLAAVDTAEK